MITIVHNSQVGEFNLYIHNIGHMGNLNYD